MRIHLVRSLAIIYFVNLGEVPSINMQLRLAKKTPKRKVMIWGVGGLGFPLPPHQQGGGLARPLLSYRSLGWLYYNSFCRRGPQSPKSSELPALRFSALLFPSAKEPFWSVSFPHRCWHLCHRWNPMHPGHPLLFIAYCCFFSLSP